MKNKAIDDPFDEEIMKVKELHDLEQLNKIRKRPVHFTEEELELLER